jgi:hypothetical protein
VFGLLPLERTRRNCHAMNDRKDLSQILSRTI